MIERDEDERRITQELECYEDPLLRRRHASEHSMNGKYSFLPIQSPEFSCLLSPIQSRTSTQLQTPETSPRRWSDFSQARDFKRQYNACHNCAKNNNVNGNWELPAALCGEERPVPSVSNQTTFSGKSCPSYHSDASFFWRDSTGNAGEADSEDGEFHTLPATTDTTQGQITMNPESACPDQPGTSYGVPDKSMMIPAETGKQLPCHIMYVDDHANLQAVKTFDDLSEFLCQAATDQKYRFKDVDIILEKIIKIPIGQIVHYASIGEYLRYLYDDEKLKDVIIEVDSKVFSAHRVALACHSQYFRELFLSSKGRKIPFEIKLRGVSAEAFEEFLEFVYTGKINISPQIAADLIVVADYLKVASLQERCDNIANNLPMDQALKLVEKSKTVPESRVYDQVFRVIRERFSEVTRQEEFLWLDIDTLCQFLTSDELVVATEFEVFQGALRWIVHNIEERVKFTIRLMELIRFTYMTQDELFTCVETTNLLKSYDKFREMILIANWIITARMMNMEDPFGFPFPQPRKCYGETKSLIFKSEGQSNNNTKLAKIEPKFFIDESAPSAFKELSSSRKRREGKKHMDSTPMSQPNYDMPSMEFIPRSPPKSDMPSMDFTPRSPPKCMMSAMEFTPRCPPQPIMTSTPTKELEMSPVMTSTPKVEITSKIPEPPMMPQPRHQERSRVQAPELPKERPHTTRDIQSVQFTMHKPGVSKIADILVIGGFEEEDKKDDVKFVERYDSQDNQWVHYSKLPEPRRHHAATTMGSKLYLIGGCDPLSPNKSPLRSCWQLDLNTKEWKQIAPMSSARSDLCVCSLFGMIYAIGGKDETGSVLETVECYNPKSNTWFWVAPMNKCRLGATAAVYDGRLVVVGGCGDVCGVPSSLPVLNSVETFDPKQNSWTRMRNLRIPRCYANLVNINGRLFLCAGATRSYNSKNSLLTSLASIDEYQKTTDSWTHVTDLVIPRHCAGVTVLAERIFIIGGISSTSDRVLQSIETFDTVRNIWVSGIQELPRPAHWISCVAVPAKH